MHGVALLILGGSWEGARLLRSMQITQDLLSNYQEKKKHFNCSPRSPMRHSGIAMSCCLARVEGVGILAMAQR